MQNRSCNLNELRISNINQKVTLVGWLENVRKVSKSLAFIVLRDYYGKTQVVVENYELRDIINAVNLESTIMVKGIVRERESKNPDMPTGEIEVVADEITILGKCLFNQLPFDINRSKEVDENIRLKYRFLDLRNPEVKKNIILRSKIINDLRQSMVEKDFLEITTPILTNSSPEGARDYLVPARNFPGMFYALPQAPQQFKQLLMASGFDKYFQIAPCFRDEDARADRSPGEFYQLDMEMAFASQEDVFAVIESVIPPVFEKYGVYSKSSHAPFERISYTDAIEIYGSDKPDLRIDLKLTNVTELLKNSEFEAFKNCIINAVIVDNFTESRKFIEDIVTETKVQTSMQTYWFKIDENNNLVGGVSKFLDKEIINSLNLKSNTLVMLACGDKLTSQKTGGVLIKTLGKSLNNHIDRNCYKFCWIVDFPMYEIGEKSGKLEFCHNPFSMPQGGIKALEDAGDSVEKLLNIKAYQYDLVCNGIELSSGAVRNHNPELMVKAFEVVGLGEEDVKSKFPAMFNAFCYGAPPHAGIAPGIDRMVMLITNEECIREVIAFPMNKKAQDLMTNAPSNVSEQQLKELNIKIVMDNKEK